MSERFNVRWCAGSAALFLAAANAKITMLGHDGPVAWRMQDGKLVIDVPQLTVDRLPCLHAWVFKIPGGR